MKRILCVYPFDPETQARLRAISADLEIDFSGPDGKQTVNAIEDATLDALLANYCPVDLGRVPSLKWLATVGAGVEHLKAVDPWSRGITVTNGSGLHITAMGEFAVAAMLTFSQKVADRQRNAAGSRDWPAAWSEAWKALCASALRGRTLTVVGYGSIGREVARLASAFGMRILAVKARPDLRKDPGYTPPGTGDPEGRLPERFGDISQLEEFFSRSDYAVLTLPSTPRTERIVGRAAIGALPRHAVLVNIARGRILDEEALGDALRRGDIRGAALDVAWTEPLPATSPLWEVPNLVLTPHVSGISDPDRFWDLVIPLMTENITRYAAGRELLNVTDGRAGY